MSGQRKWQVHVIITLAVELRAYLVMVKYLWLSTAEANQLKISCTVADVCLKKGLVSGKWVSDLWVGMLKEFLHTWSGEKWAAVTSAFLRNCVRWEEVV
jgi:hypothetical protein